jgi:hypothetical protein
LINDIVEHVKIMNPMNVNCAWTTVRIYGVTSQRYQFNNSQAMGAQSK